MRHAAVALIVCAVLVPCLSASGQPGKPRELQIGTKTSDAGYALVSQLPMKLGDLAKMEGVVTKAVTDLTQQATDAGFTCLSRVHVAMLGPLPPPADGHMTMEIRLPIIEQPTEDELKPGAALQIAKLEPTKVAYTYHKGPLEDPQSSFFRLIHWLTGQTLEIAGPPCIIIYGTPDQDPMQQTAELQVPVK